MRYLLDSNIVIAAIDGRHDLLRARLQACDADDLVTSAIVYTEVAHGSLRGKAPAQAILDDFLAEIPVLPFDQAAALVHASLPFKRGSFDQLIGAHAIALGLTLITDNLSDFRQMPLLAVESWLRP